MSKKGLVVPDNPTPSDWKIVPLRVPNDPQWLGIIAGLLFSPCNGYWWKKNSGDWESARDTMCQIATGFQMTELCDDIAECIENSETIRDIFERYCKDCLVGVPTTPLGVGIPSLDTCSKDHMFGAVTELVDYMNTVIIDVLELIESATNILEAVNLWADNSGITGILASRLIETIDWIISTVTETYSANYTSALRDEYRCEIFCLWVESTDCKLTPQMVTNYFQARTDYPGLTASVVDMMEYIVGDIFLGSEIPDVMHFLLSACLTFDDRIGFFEITSINNFQTAIALGANNPDPDWSILCEPCAIPVWCYTWLGGDEFTPAWTINSWLSVSGTYDAVNDRLVAGKSPTPTTGATLDISYVITPTDVTEISVTISWLATRTTGTDGVYFIIDGVQKQFNSIGASGTDAVFTYTPAVAISATTIKIQSISAGNSAGDSAFLYMNKLTVNGEGTNAFGTSNC